MGKVGIERLSESADNPSLNVVFVHGLGGGPRDTWTYKASESDHRFWPDWLLKEIPGLAAYTVRYPADKMGWSKGWPIEQAAVAVSKTLQTDESLRAGETPIVFVCHSLGGVIVKKLILKARSVREVNTPTGAFLDRIAGVVFLATPHDGSTMATIASRFGWLVSDTMKDLVANSSKLGDISNDYRNYVAANNGRIRHEVYYENDSVDVEEPVSALAAKFLGAKAGKVVGFIAGKIVGGAAGKVVTSGSANPGLAGPDPVPIGRDHINICKVADTNDEVYKGIRTFLKGALEQRPDSTRTLVEDTRQTADATKANTEALLQQTKLNNAQLGEIYDFVRRSGALQRAEDQGISEVAVRAIVERLGGLGLGRDDLVPWLDQWTADIAHERAIGTSEGEAYQRLVEKAEGLFDAGRLDEASEPFMAELARRQEAEKQVNLRLVEDAIKYDKRAFNGEAAAEKLRVMARIEGAETTDAIGAYLLRKASEFYKEGDQAGDNAALLVSIAACRAALEERTRDRVPLDWAQAQSKLGVALATVGERESGTAHVEEAIVAYRAALQEWTRERVPLAWAMTQMNIGNALATLGERENGTARLEEAVAAYRAALEEATRDLAPLDWALIQNNLGNALTALGERDREIMPTCRRIARNLFRVPGEREYETMRLEQALSAFRAALEERTRERAPLDWAMTQNNLGNALEELGTREKGTARLEEAVAAYRAALQEWTRDRVPLDWARTQTNLGTALRALGERESGTARLEEAVAAHRAALQERTRDRVPFDWAMTQNNLGNALRALGVRESGTAHLEEAVAAYRAAGQEWTPQATPYWHSAVQKNLARAVVSLTLQRAPRLKFVLQRVSQILAYLFD